MTDLAASVIFSTYNGASRRMREMLDSLIQQDLPRDRWEIIAVDNNSRDDTHAVLLEYRDRLPLTILQQKKPGKSAALNLALDHARGDLLIFTDDDIRAEPGWVSALVNCAADNPDVNLFGGRILADWEKPPTDRFLQWIPMGSTFAIVEEDFSGPCDYTKVWGPNTAIRRSALGSERYNETIGPLPGGLFAMGEDLEIVLRLARRGLSAYRCGGAVVHHWIPAASVSEEWVQQRAERLAYGMPVLFPNDVPKGVRIAGVPIKTWLESANWAVRALVYSLFPPSNLRFWAIWKHRYMRGYRAGIRKYVPQAKG